MLQNFFKAARNSTRERTRDSLPAAPNGMAWWQHPKTREWKLMSREDVYELEQKQKERKQKEAEAEAEEADEEEQQEKQINDQHEKEVHVVDFDFANPPNDKEDLFANPFNLPKSAATTVEEEHEDDEDEGQVPITKEDVTIVLHNLPPFITEDSKTADGEGEEEGDDWELLSDRYNSSSNNNNHNRDGVAFVSRTGSISSHYSDSNHSWTNHNSISASLKLHRTPSSSTIDSQEYSITTTTTTATNITNIGAAVASGKAILGIDYVEHVILPSDTLQGICLAYKISASRLKRANHFTGDNLAQAPSCLMIPISKQALRQGCLRLQQNIDSKEYKLHAFLSYFNNNNNDKNKKSSNNNKQSLGHTEAKAYLELTDWNLQDAVRSAREDFEWEKSSSTTYNQDLSSSNDTLKAGQIRVMMKASSGTCNNSGKDGNHNKSSSSSSSSGTTTLYKFCAQGAGLSPKRRSTSRHGGEEEKEQDTTVSIIKPIDPKRVHAKAVQVEDIYAVAPQHNSYGVEMKSFCKK